MKSQISYFSFLIMMFLNFLQMQLSVLFSKKLSFAISFQEKPQSLTTSKSFASIARVQIFLPRLGSMILQNLSLTCNQLLIFIFSAIFAQFLIPQCSNNTISIIVSRYDHLPVLMCGLILLWNSQQISQKLRFSMNWQIFSQLSLQILCFSIIISSQWLVYGLLGVFFLLKSSQALQTSKPVLQVELESESSKKLILHASLGNSAKLISFLFLEGRSSLSFFMNQKSSSPLFLMASCISITLDCSFRECGVFLQNFRQLSMLLAGGYSVLSRWVLMNSSKLCNLAEMSSLISMIDHSLLLNFSWVLRLRSSDLRNS